MADNPINLADLKQAPVAHKAWAHLRLAMVAGLHRNPKTASKIARGIRLGR